MIPSQFNSDVSIWPKLQQIYAVRENIGYFCVVIHNACHQIGFQQSNKS